MAGDKPWLRFWPEWAPTSIEDVVSDFTPVHEEILRRRDRGGCVLVQAETGYCYTLERLRRAAYSIAGWLQGEGAGRGVQVGLSSENTIEALAAFLGALASGARVVLIDPLTISEDLLMQLEGRGIEVFIASKGFLARNGGVLARAGVRSVLELSAEASEVEGVRVTSLPRAAYGHKPDDPGIREGDDSIALYYSGIAGRTMQTIHHHRGLQLAVKAFSYMARLDEDSYSLLVAPFTHVLGLQLSFLAPLASGGRVVSMARWSPELCLEILKAGMANYLAGAPTMYKQLYDKASGGEARVRLAISAGAPLDPALQKAFPDKFSGPLLQAYGMTESLLVAMQAENIKDYTGTLGIPLPGVDVLLVDPGDPTREVGPGGEGELLVKAPWVMKGYELAEETERAFHGEWLKTGDIIYMSPEGLLYFRGLKKRIIKYKGYTILPRDLEAILESHPHVEEARVYGVKREDVGEIPVARVKLKKGAKASKEELMEYVNSRVAFYKKIRDLIIED